MTTASVTQLHLFRQQFPALKNKAYFNYGGQGPMPQQAIEALRQAQDTIQEQGPFTSALNTWIFEQAAQTREAIATELNVAPTTITLTEDVSVGCNIGLWGIDWQPGDHLLLSDCEHPGIVAAALEIQRRFGVDVSTCPLKATLNQGDPVAIVAQHLRPTTRLLVVSHILWNTGQVLPLKEIVAVCHGSPTRSMPVRVLVDAAQSVGVLPLRLAETDVDFYAFTEHKWWCGAAGVGALYVSPDAMGTLSPTFIGWRGIVSDAAGNPTGWKPDARRYEIATSDYPLYASLRESIAVHNHWGTATQRYERIRALSQLLWRRLRDIPQVECLRTAPPEAGLVSFQVTQGITHTRLVQMLEQQGFMLRTIYDPDCVRACVHYLTLESEIEQLTEAIAQLLQS